MPGYGVFAEFYDSLTSDVGYSGRTDYILSLFQRFGSNPNTLIDLACGTGGFSLEFCRRGIAVTGVDMSSDMLSVARNKALEQNAELLLVCQRAEELELAETAGGAVCCLDSVNHITDPQALESAFSRLSNYIEKGGLFVFDINSIYKHREILGDNTFVYETDDVYLVWRNELIDDRDVNLYLDFFVYNGESYDRYSEDFSERGYTEDEIKILLEKSGFEPLGFFDDMSFEPVRPDSERIIVAARKV